MPQGLLGFHYESDSRKNDVTALAGLPLYLDMAHAIDLPAVIRNKLRTRERGWTDAQLVMAVVLLNLAGGDRVEDLGVLEGDDGFCRLLMRVEDTGLTRAERRAKQRRWRKLRRRAIPSPSAMFRFLSAFHSSTEEERRKRSQRKAFIPKPNQHLRALSEINAAVVAAAQERDPVSTATLDLDATLVDTTKAEALYGYKGHKAYQPLNLWWAEQETMVHTEFRDGNVPAGYDLARVVRDGIELLPAGVKSLSLRSDAAAYDHRFLRFLHRGVRPYGRVRFAVGAYVTDSFKEATSRLPETAWKPLNRQGPDGPTEGCQEYAELPYVPRGLGWKRRADVFRYLAIREPMSEQALPGMEEQQQLPFQTIRLRERRYKLFGVVTNVKDPHEDPEEGWDGQRVIGWYRKRCGKSEDAHAVLKNDLAGGTMPSKYFGANAAWWSLSVLAMNLNGLVKRFCLGGEWIDRRLKAIRFAIIRLPGLVVEHARRMIVRIARGHPSFELLITARRRLLESLCVPSG